MRRFHLILLLLVALLGAVIALGITRSPVLGLDLQGGLEVVLEAQAPPGREVTDADLDRSIEIMRNRIDKIGVSEPEIRKQGSNQIVIELAGVHDQGRAAELIGKTAQLQFYDLEGDLTGPSISSGGFPLAEDRLYLLLKGQQAAAEKGTPSAWYLYSDVEDPAGRAGAHKAGHPRRLPRAARRRRARSSSQSRATGSSSRAARRPPSVPASPRPRRRRPTTTSSSTQPTSGTADPGDDRRRPPSDGDSPGLRHPDRPARRPHAVHRLGRGQVPRHHPEARDPRADADRATGERAADPAALRDRARRRDPVVARRSTSSSTRTGSRATTVRRSRASTPRRRRRTSRSSSRPVPCRSASSRSIARTSRQRSVRTPCARR